MIARDAKKTIDYVLEDERNAPPEARTTWTLGVISARAHAAIADETLTFAPSGKVTGFRNALHTLLTVAYGLRGVSGLKGEDGEDLTLTWADGSGGPRVADSFLDQIPPAVRLELANRITDLNSVGPEERKN